VGQSVAIGANTLRSSRKREENQLLVFERKVLRTIYGLKMKNGHYKRKYNHELDKDFNSPNALNVTKTGRLLYA
jgi:hypothetical protein